MILHIREIDKSDTYALRHSELRAAYPFETVIFPTDELPGCIHFGLYNEDGKGIQKLISIETFYPSINPAFKTESQYQLRGMATHSDFRNRNAGRLLLTYGILRLKEKDIDLVWCNAREIAFSFYERLDFEKTGERFYSFEVPHKTMFLNLKQ